MKYRAKDSFYSSETKQVRGGHVFEAGDFGLSEDRIKQMVKNGLIEPADGDAESSGNEANIEGASGGDSDPSDLDKMTRAQLDELAVSRQIDTSAAKTKGDVIDLLRKAEPAPKNKAEDGAPKNKSE